MQTGLIIAYSATAISISGRFIFMYLLYTKKSTNTYSLVFSILNMVSSSLWITYGQMITDMPLLVRGSSDLVLFSFIRRNSCVRSERCSPEKLPIPTLVPISGIATISTAYILSNRREQYRIVAEPV